MMVVTTITPMEKMKLLIPKHMENIPSQKTNMFFSKKPNDNMCNPWKMDVVGILYPASFWGRKQACFQGRLWLLVSGSGTPKNEGNRGFRWVVHDMGVSENRGTPKSSILIGFSIIKKTLFWGTTIFANSHMVGMRNFGHQDAGSSPPLDYGDEAQESQPKHLSLPNGRWGSIPNDIYKDALQGTNTSHLGKRKIIFKMPFWGDMLVPRRVMF